MMQKTGGGEDSSSSSSSRAISLAFEQIRKKWLEAEEWRKTLVSHDTIKRNPGVRGAYLIHCEYRKVELELRFIEGVLPKLHIVSNRGTRSCSAWIAKRRKEDVARERLAIEARRRFHSRKGSLISYFLAEEPRGGSSK